MWAQCGVGVESVHSVGSKWGRCGIGLGFPIEQHHLDNFNSDAGHLSWGSVGFLPFVTLSVISKVDILSRKSTHQLTAAQILALASPMASAPTTETSQSRSDPSGAKNDATAEASCEFHASK